MGKQKGGELVAGTLEMLILKTLRREALHGYGIARAIEGQSGDVLRVEEGSLYPALHRLEMDGLIAAEWGHSANNRRARYYRLTRAGRKRLADEQAQWERLVGGVARVLGTA